MSFSGFYGTQWPSNQVLYATGDYYGTQAPKGLKAVAYSAAGALPGAPPPVTGSINIKPPPEAPKSGSRSPWDIVGSIFGDIAEGAARGRQGGQQPYPQPVPGTGGPSTTTLLLIGAAVIGGVVLLKRRK